MFRRIALFLVTNLAVLFVLNIVAHLVGADRWLRSSGSGLDIQSLLVFASIFGFGGSFISLALSKTMAKWSTGAHVIDAPRTEEEHWLLQTVGRHAQSSGIQMPEVAVYDSQDMNAFATGMTRNSSLVAVSTGLLRRMRRNEVDAVLGHEIGHVANGDMVTLSLLQGILNTFVIFMSRVVGFAIDNFLSRRDEGGRRGTGFGYWIRVMVLEMIFGILASLIVMWFSRRREFRADEAGASLAGRQNMIQALERLHSDQLGAKLPGSLAAFGIRSGGSGLLGLFRSHPPLEARIAALREMKSS